VHPWPATRSPGPATLTETTRLRAILRATAPDVAHLHSSKAGLAGRLALRGEVPTIFQPHLWSFQAEDSPLTPLARTWERLGARWAHHLVCVSDEERRVGISAGIDGNYAVIANGVDSEKIRPSTDAAALRASLDLPDGPLAVCVGRLARQKGQDMLLQAWQDVISTHPTALLVMVGDGPLARQLQESTHGRHPSVRWVGNRGNATAYMAAADVVVVPSRAEGMALVPMEAMASGTCVVAFDCGGMKQSVGTAGAVLPVGDLDGLGAEIRKRFDDPELAGSEGLAGRARVEMFFDHRSSSRATAQLTRSLTSGQIAERR
jgi:glycosyltransferase involved in cell wall biosynthesis